MMGFRNKFQCVAVMLIVLAAGAGWANVVEADAEYSIEPLRDPFWPVGYFPDDWKKDQPNEDMPPVTAGSDWDVPTTLLHISGTSRMGDKAVAIINGDLKEIGDAVEVRHNGRVYQWKLKDVKASGKVSLERVGISSGLVGFQPGDKK
jgi:hypothetical protein